VALQVGRTGPQRPGALMGDAGDLLVAFPEEVAQLAKVVGVALAAEEDLDGREIPDDGVTLVAAVGLAGLSEGLERDDGADPGAAARGQQLVDGVQRRCVGGFVEGDEQRRIKPTGPLRRSCSRSGSATQDRSCPATARRAVGTLGPLPERYCARTND